MTKQKCQPFSMLGNTIAGGRPVPVRPAPLTECVPGHEPTRETRDGHATWSRSHANAHRPTEGRRLVNEFAAQQEQITILSVREKRAQLSWAEVQAGREALEARVQAHHAAEAERGAERARDQAEIDAIMAQDARAYGAARRAEQRAKRRQPPQPLWERVPPPEPKAKPATTPRPKPSYRALLDAYMARKAQRSVTP